MIDKDRLVHKIEHNYERTVSTFRWIGFSVVMGVVMGIIGALFTLAIADVTRMREHNPYFLLLLPVGAVAIRLLYRLAHYENDGGTNLVLSSIQGDDYIPGRMSLLIFLSTIASHLVGASVGREGAALQLGGSIGGYMGTQFSLDDTQRKTVTMCCMSASFAALFGTPMTAAVFSMEVISVGIMHYAALVPCVLASYIASGVAGMMGAERLSYTIAYIPTLDFKHGVQCGLFAILAGTVSMLFCIALRQTEVLTRKYMPNDYIRAAVCGTLLLVMTFMVGDQAFNGSGVETIDSCMSGNEHTWAFLLKIIFTCVSIAAGYKGGEIIPSLFIGASFGSFVASVTGLDPTLCAAVGMGSVFCGVTNCPITSLLLCFELFGMEASPYFMIAIALAYVVSGYYSLYHSQKIVYSKYKSNYIDKNAE